MLCQCNCEDERSEVSSGVDSVDDDAESTENCLF